jgi:hypothetical protein
MSAAASYARWVEFMGRIGVGQISDLEELDPSCSRQFTSD